MNSHQPHAVRSAGPRRPRKKEAKKMKLTDRREQRGETEEVAAAEWKKN